MRFAEEDGAEIDAAGVERRTEVRLLPAEAEGVATAAGCNHVQVSMQLRRIRICARAPQDTHVLLHRCDAKNCPVVGAIRSDGNRLSCFVCNYDLCEMCARR